MATSVLAAGEYSLAPDQAGRFLRETFATAKNAETLDQAAESLVAQMRSKREREPGLGYPALRYIDPQAEQLKTLAIETGV
ncbi:hypothetical protein ACN1C3_16645 [Pseudomonas sp. H11T01]|uniref:hypothetical protein n=1 Tax=Pseudomonas sp. H11T01 TaxID=3402749 RepID=UPI003AC960E3